MDALRGLCERAGLIEVEVRPIEIDLTAPDFDDYWTAQTPGFSPTGKAVAALSDHDRARLKDAVRALVMTDGCVSYKATANAWKARAPG